MAIHGVVHCCNGLPLFCNKVGAGSASEQPQDERQEGGYQQAGHEGEVKTEIVAFDVNVARQSAEPGGESRGEGDDQTGSNQDQSQYDQRSAEPVHAFFSRGR